MLEEIQDFSENSRFWKKLMIWEGIHDFVKIKDRATNSMFCQEIKRFKILPKFQHVARK